MDQREGQTFNTALISWKAPQLPVRGADPHAECTRSRCWSDSQSLPLPGSSPLYTLLTHCQTWNRSILQFGDLHAELCCLIQEWLISLTSTNSVETNAGKSLCWLF